MGKTKLNAGRKKAELERSRIASPEIDIRTLLGKSQPCGDTQIIGDGLN